MDNHHIGECAQQQKSHPDYLGRGCYRTVFRLKPQVLKIDRFPTKDPNHQQGGCALEYKIFTNEPCEILAPVTGFGTTTIENLRDSYFSEKSYGRATINWLTMPRMTTVKELINQEGVRAWCEPTFMRNLASEIISSLSRYPPFRNIASETWEGKDTYQLLPSGIGNHLTLDLSLNNVGQCPVSGHWFIIDYACKPR